MLGRGCGRFNLWLAVVSSINNYKNQIAFVRMKKLLVTLGETKVMNEMMYFIFSIQVCIENTFMNTIKLLNRSIVFDDKHYPRITIQVVQRVYKLHAFSQAYLHQHVLQ